MRIAGPALCSLALVMTAAPALADKTVSSLDQVRGAIKTQDAKKLYDGEMSGAKQPDGLGRMLPAGFTTGFLVSQLAPGQDPQRLVVAGAKPWPARANGFVAMVCLARTAQDAKQAARYGGGDCRDASNDGSDAKDVWFGVFDASAGGTPTLVARTEAPVVTPTDWRDTDIDLPQALDDGDAKSAAHAAPETWTRFDLAPYEITKGDFAFGVRAGWSEGYAGGGAEFEALYLFRIEGRALRVVFAQPMSFLKMIAGDWHKDGTRSHDVSDASNSLVLLSSKTEGMRDLQLRQQKGKWRRTFTWSAERHRYE